MSLICVIALFVAVSAFAAPVTCPSTTTGTVATFADLLALNGTGGCTIGDKLFTNFIFNATVSGSPAPVPLTSSQVQINTVNTPTDIGFQFAFSLAASTMQTNDILLQYVVSTTSGAPLITAERLSETGNFSGNGSAVVDEAVCVGAAWSGASCAGTVRELSTFFNTFGMKPVDSTTFGAVSTLGIRKDINVSGNVAGFASISGVANSVGQVPEPGTYTMLLGGAMVLLSSIKLRRKA
jgi:hypothetical protein